MIDKTNPPEGWHLTESQNLHNPFSCEKVQAVTSSYPTAAEAIADAWDKADDDPLNEAIALLRRIDDGDHLHHEDEELCGEVGMFLQRVK